MFQSKNFRLFFYYNFTLSTILLTGIHNCMKQLSISL